MDSRAKVSFCHPGIAPKKIGQDVGINQRLLHYLALSQNDAELLSR